MRLVVVLIHFTINFKAWATNSNQKHINYIWHDFIMYTVISDDISKMWSSIYWLSLFFTIGLVNNLRLFCNAGTLNFNGIPYPGKICFHGSDEMYWSGMEEIISVITTSSPLDIFINFCRSTSIIWESFM